MYNNLPFLKYSFENGEKFDDWTTFYAAQVGNLEMMEYLYEKKCNFGICLM